MSNTLNLNNTSTGNLAEYLKGSKSQHATADAAALEAAHVAHALEAKGYSLSGREQGCTITARHPAKVGAGNPVRVQVVLDGVYPSSYSGRQSGTTWVATATGGDYHAKDVRRSRVFKTVKGADPQIALAKATALAEACDGLVAEAERVAANRKANVDHRNGQAAATVALGLTIEADFPGGKVTTSLGELTLKAGFAGTTVGITGDGFEAKVDADKLDAFLEALAV